MTNRKKIDSALNFDALDFAEKLTNKSYKEDDLTSSLGLGLFLKNNSKKKKLLEDSGDTTFSNKISDYIRVIESMGFELILKDPFLNEDDIEENFYVFWNYEHGVMIRFDSFTYRDDGSFKNGVPEPSVNSCNMFYNWIPNKGVNVYSFTSSGGYNGDVWVGSHDGREAIKHKLNGLLENGKFLNNWIEQPFLWLLTYMDTKNDGYDYELITKERISRLPKKVIESINPPTSN